ncbi:MAG: MBG domain-containing protein [Acidobacteriia bacterium]|nr:MBG domain-containing protein [Terriglobia bacterium]
MAIMLVVGLIGCASGGSQSSTSPPPTSSPSIASPSGTSFTLGTGSSFVVVASGNPAPSLIESGALPSGVTFTDNGNGTATITWTNAVNAPGVYHITVTAHNGVGSDATQSFTLTVNQAAAITTANNAAFTAGSSGSFTVIATGFPIPTLSRNGALPSGVSFTDNGNGTATLSGTPGAGGGGYNFSITAHNGVGVDVTQSFTLSVKQAAAITSPIGSTAESFVVGSAGTLAVTSTGVPTPKLICSPLPSGVTLTDHGDGTGTLGGTPAAGTVGSYTVTITAQNGVGADATQTITLQINKAAPIITWAAPSAISYGTALSATQLDATASVPGSFVYSPAAGTVLNAGNQNVSVTFTPNDTADYNTASANVTLTINKATATVSFGNLTQTYDGTPKPASVATAPSGVSVTLSYSGINGMTYGPSATAPTSAGSYSVAATTNDPNYSGSGSGTLQVNKAAPIVTWSNPTAIIFGTALSAAQLNATANVPGSFVYAPPLGTVLSAGSQNLSVVFTPTDAADYTTATVNVPLSVNQAAASVALGNLSQNYDGSAKAVTATTTPSGLAVTFFYSGISGTTYGPSATAPTSAGTYSVTVSVNDPNYSGSGSGTLTVNKATPSINWATPAPVTFGAALGISQLNATANVPGTLAYNPSAGTVPSAGSQNLSVTFTPTDTTNYATATASVALTVNKAAPSVTWIAPAAITYGTALSAAQLNASANVPGSFVYNPGGGTVLGAGSQSLSVTFTPTDATDYTTVTANVTLIVNKAAPSIAWAAPAAITYGTALSATQLNATANVPGSFAYNPSGGAVLNAGSQNLSATFTPADNADYTTATASVPLIVNQTAATVALGNLNQTYDGAPKAASATTTPSGLGVTFSYSGISGTIYGPSATAPTGAGMYSVTAAVNDPNYSGGVSGTLTVNKATPAITWVTPAAVTYGTALGAAQLNATASVPGNFVYNPVAGTVLGAGSQNLSAAFTPADTADYNTSSANVTLTVNKAAASVTLGNLAQTYDSTPKAVSAATTPSGLAFTFSYSGIGGTVYGPSATAPTGAGTYSVSATINDTNYAGNASGTLTVNKATPSITWATPAAISFGAALGSAQLNATANVPGNFVYNPAAGTVPGGGNQNLSVTFTPTDTADYTAATANVTLTVNKATPVITWVTPAAITFGAALSAAQLNATANVPGSFAYNPVAGTVLNAGSQNLSVTFTPTDAADYTTATAGVNVTVNKAATTVSLGNLSQTYDGSPKAASATTVPPSLGLTFSYLGISGTTYGLSATAPAGAGSYSVTATINDANYSGTNSATLTVNKATPSVTWATPASITAGTALSGTQLNATASVPGTFVYAPPSGTILPVGAQSLSVTFTPADTADYTTGTATVTITVVQAAAITSANSAAFAVGALGSFTITASGFPVPSLASSGVLPSGVTFTVNGNGTAALAGTPAAATGGSYQITITAHNGVGADAIQALTLVVNQAAAITSAASVAFAEGTPGVFAVAATGTPKPTISESGALPAGVTFNAANGTLSGSPNSGTAGSYPLTFSAHNGIGADATQSFVLNVDLTPAITIQPANQSVTLGQAATFQVAATGTTPLTFQWRKNGATIANATSSTYTTPATTTADNGASFDVVVANAVGSATSNPATLTVNTPPVITGFTQSQAVSAGQPATFMVSATGSTPMIFVWYKNNVAIANATQSSYTIPQTTIADDGAQFIVTVGNAFGNATSPASQLTVNPGQAADVVTYHNDIARTGQNLAEALLMPGNVTSATFGKVNQFPVDGRVDAQPLYLSNVAIPNRGTHNVLYVATEHDTVYAFDATSGFRLWNKSLLGSGETPSDPRGCGQVTPEIGITSTPVIDRGRGAIYVIAMSKNASGNYFQRLHALDITTGNELFSGPRTIQATYPGTGDNSSGPNVVFDPAQYKERAALLLLNGVVYTAWASHCDIRPYTGWVMGYDASTLTQTSVLNITPNGNEGAIWMSGAGLAADESGNIYLLAGNGTFDATLNANGFPGQGDYGNAFLKLSTSGGLQVADYFEMSNQSSENAGDVDLGSGGVLLLPNLVDSHGNTQQLAVGAGKDQNIYVVSRNGMGKFNSGANNVYQQITGIFPGGAPAGIYSSPAYFNNTIYFGSIGNPIMAFGVSAAVLSSTPTSQTNTSFAYPGATPGISAKGTANGILWAVENNGTAAVLHAYDATNLANELYNSNQASGGRDQFGPGNKFITPTIANGNVYVGTPNSVAVFGLLPSYTSTLTLPSITTQPASQTVNEGQTATFSVAATGSAPLSYQWQSNGSNIAGATSSSYTTPATTALDGGTRFTVVVSNTAGSTTSTAATLKVNSPPSIATPPANLTVLAGETATFSATATATPAPTYQWQMNGVDIPGATGSTYTTPVTTLADNGEQFTVRATNALGSQLSSSATLTVVPHPSPETYYVDADSGLDSNSGLTKNAPWQHAPGMATCSSNCSLIALAGGDHIVLKGGAAWNGANFPMVVHWSGTPGNPITFGVDPTWFKGAAWARPVFDLTNGVWNVAPVLANSVNYVVFDNLEIANEQVDQKYTWPPRSALSVNGGSNVTIQNCSIHGWSIQNPVLDSDSDPIGGIAFYNGSTGGVVRNCVLDGSPEADSGIGIYGGAVIQGNIIKNMPNGIQVVDPGIDVSGNQIFNVTYSADPGKQQNGILVQGGGNVYNNIVHDVVPGAFAVYLESAWSGAGNTQSVYNNLVWNPGDNSDVTVDPDALAFELRSNQLIYNNTLSAGSAACVSVTPRNFSPTSLTVENNHCISDLAASQAWCWFVAGANNGCGPVMNLTFGNNVLMTTSTATSGGYTSSNSFQPSAGNKDTVGAGLNLSALCGSIGAALCSDRLGVPRPAGSTPWDAGAYLFQSVPVSLPPAITAQPMNVAVAVGQAATFSVVATGTGPLSYAWYKNGIVIAGAASSAYTTPVAAATDNAAQFAAVVSSALGSVTSSAATLSVDATKGQLVASTSNLNFGIVSIGNGSTMGVTLTNPTVSYVTILSVVLSGPGFDASDLPTGYIVPPGGSLLLNVGFAPSSAGNVAGTLVISSDASITPITINLSGAGLQPVPHAVTLTWDAAPSVAGYYVYRSPLFGGPFTKLNFAVDTSTTYTDPTAMADGTYYYVVTSVDATGVESLYSDQVTVVAPVP